MANLTVVRDSELEKKIQEWRRLDKWETTRTELESLVNIGDINELRRRLLSRMKFGTAGLRSEMGAGFSRMNDLTVIQTSQGLCSYLMEQFPEAKARGVIIGFDARHNSSRFAKRAASAFLSKGFKVYLFSSITPTPYVPFGVRKYGCVCGIMVTASHNPKQDNGYKVYWDNGAQIIPPIDKGIANSILKQLDPWSSAWDLSSLETSPLVVDPYEQIHTEYMDALKKYSVNRERNASCPIRFTYTAMHGVGAMFVEEAFRTFNLPGYIPVKQQVEPDPEFPTVRFPNPEEGKSALNLSMETAVSNNSCVILANDPDADRLAVAERQEGGQWKVFNGNEIGVLLGWWSLESKKRQLKAKGEPFVASKYALLNSTVSSRMLGELARAEGLHHEETLTGFKWMGNKTVQLGDRGVEVLFAYEEAIGFMFGRNVVDKDGVSAAVVAAEMRYELEKQGLTFSKKLEELYSTYGRFASETRYVICNDPQLIKAIFEEIRKGGTYPVREVGGAKIVGVRDLTLGYDSTCPPHYKTDLPADSSSQMITFTCDNNCVFTLRTSGTEPKIKYYVDISYSPGLSHSQEELLQTLHRMQDAILETFLKPEENGLLTPPASPP
jgi:phosphoglucomutase/phosphopentomutase